MMGRYAPREEPRKLKPTYTINLLVVFYGSGNVRGRRDVAEVGEALPPTLEFVLAGVDHVKQGRDRGALLRRPGLLLHRN